MRQVFGVSRLQNQMSGIKQDSSMKKTLDENFKSEIRAPRLEKIYEESEAQQFFGKRQIPDDHEFHNLYEITKQLASQAIAPITTKEELSADLLMRYDIVQEPMELKFIEEQRQVDIIIEEARMDLIQE